MNPVALLAVEALRRGIPVELTARGDSMRPLLYDGDRISVTPLGTAGLKLDDVAVALVDQQLIVHRVVSLAPLTLRGDALPEDDSALTNSALTNSALTNSALNDDPVLGRVSAFTRWGVTMRLDTCGGRLWSRLCRLTSRAYFRARS